MGLIYGVYLRSGNNMGASINGAAGVVLTSAARVSAPLRAAFIG
jgi:hypothetical protein